jgi:hypothetical protein
MTHSFISARREAHTTQKLRRSAPASLLHMDWIRNKIVNMYLLLHHVLAYRFLGRVVGAATT